MTYTSKQDHQWEYLSFPSDVNYFNFDQQNVSEQLVYNVAFSFDLAAHLYLAIRLIYTKT